MNKNNILWEVGGKWGIYNVIIPIVGTLLFSLLGQEMTNGWFSGVIGIIGFILTPILLYQSYRDFERKTNKTITTKSAWSIAGIFILISFIVSLVGQIYHYFSGTFDEVSEYMDDSMLAWAFTASILFQIFLYVLYVTLFAQWWMHEKAEQAGWAVFVPIYNLVCLTELAKKPGYWVFLMFIPLVNIIFAIMLVNGVSKAFGKDEGFTAGMIFLPFIFYPLIGFGKEPRWIYREQEEEDSGLDDIIEHLVE